MNQRHIFRKNIIGENNIKFFTKTENKIIGFELDRVQKVKPFKTRQKIKHCVDFCDKIMSYKFMNAQFLIVFLIWEIKSFKLLLKTYSEVDRLELKGISNRKLQKYENRPNIKLGGFFCIEEVTTLNDFITKLNFLIDYNEFVELEFIRFYNYRFTNVQSIFGLIMLSKEIKSICIYIEKKVNLEFLYLCWFFAASCWFLYLNYFKLVEYLKI